MNTDRVRAWWWHRQGLDGHLTGEDAAAVLQTAGWARSIGGANPYVALWSRAHLGRAAVDNAAAELTIQELPAARGCTYVVPEPHYDLALSCAARFPDADMRTARALGVTDREIDLLCGRVLTALESAPLDPEAIRDRVGDAARSLGPEGAAKGLSTTLPLALGRLQVSGHIRRTPADGRLDRQRYRYAVWKRQPEAREDMWTQLARLYFRWIGPATLAEFQWFSGLGMKAAKEAAAPLGLTCYGARCMFPDDLEAMHTMRMPDEPQYRLLTNLDNLIVLRRGVRELVAGEDTSRLPIDKDLPNHGIFDRGRLVGLWEYDFQSRCIVWAQFIRSCPEIRAAIREAEDFIRTELGDVRGYSLDSPKSRQARIEALRSAV